MTHLHVARAIRAIAWTLLLTVVPALLAACGGGGGGAPPDPGTPAPTIAILKTILRGDLEVSVVDPDARGAVLVQVSTDGTLAFGCAVDAAWADQVTGMHVHRGAPGANGPVVVDLLSGGAVFDPGTAATSDNLTIDPVLAAEIVATPGDFYVNVHTSTAPDGIAREQLAVLAPIGLHAVLLGSEETSVAQADARGACSLQIEADASLSWQLATRTPVIDDVLEGHVHAGDAGIDGPVEIDLGVPGGSLDAATGLLAGSAVADLRALARLCHAPSAFYVNLHTDAAPDGVARGQLATDARHLWAPLRASEEVTPPSDPNARGGVTLQLHSFTSGTVHMAVPLAQGIDNVTMAHVHEGEAGIDGPVVVDLMAGADFVVSVPSFSAEGSIVLDRALFTRLLAAPDRFYVNFHTALDAAGAVRGQLGQDAVQLAALLDGNEETTVVDASAAGRASVFLRDVFDCAFAIHMTQPAAADVTAAHVHDGAAGTDGPALIDLLGGTNVAVSGDDITGDAAFTGRTFARLLAFAEHFYVNVHTTAAPAGVARGQLAIVDESVPPTALSYSSPVVYTEGVAIAANVPTVGGGAVASYAITPALPAGLVLNPLTGVISGTPTGTAAAANHTVTATNASGSTSATVNITVQPAAPTNLSYTSPVTYTVGTAIAANTPSHGGGAPTTYGVAPALPSGLALNTSTGVISGTPTSAAAVATYTVTASNVAGSTTFGISITVNAVLQPPSSLSYATPVSYPTGYAITPNTPTISGGAVTMWSVSPALPTGLSFSTSTGVISGTPTSISSAANYTVTAQNAAGSTTATVNVTVTLGAPANLAYTNDPNIAYVNNAIATMVPSSTGGAVASYSVSPALPAGLSLNTTNGRISGTPTTTSALTTYTVTATNATGSTTATIQIIVY